MKYELTDEEWKKLKDLLSKRKGKQGHPCVNLRRTLSGIKWILRTGSSWRALPSEFGNSSRFGRKKGLCQLIGKSKGGKTCIPCKKTYKVGRAIEREQYKKRNAVERFFQRLKENHRLAMRFDKLADRFRAFVYFAAILLWLN